AQEVKLEVDGRLVDTRTVSLEPNSAASVTFPALTVASPMRATVRAGTDALPADNQFNFVMTPRRRVSVWMIQAEGTSSSFYLATALSIGTSPPFKTETLSPSRVTPESFAKRSVVILNDTTPLSTAANDALQRFVTQGGGLLIVTGEHLPWNGSTPLLPGKVGNPVERLTGGGGTLGYIDHSHPVFEEFKDPRNGNFSAVRFFKYRAFTPSPTDKVLAKYDDGSPAVVEWTVGSGRVMLT